jgi:large subunit ribosomal protein L13
VPGSGAIFTAVGVERSAQTRYSFLFPRDLSPNSRLVAAGFQPPRVGLSPCTANWLGDVGATCNLSIRCNFKQDGPAELEDVTVSKCYLAKPNEVQPQWYVVDAKAQIVGRLATRLARILMGKHKPSYTPHVECGDFIVVVNCEKVRFSGAEMSHPKYEHFTTKMKNKIYERYTGYPGGRRFETAAQLLDRRPDHILREAVRRMLPKNKLGSRMLKKLKIYAGEQHPHQSQNPQELPKHLQG